MGNRLIGYGSYLPARVMTNADFERAMDTTDEWIVERTGIRERHFAAENETVADLACRDNYTGIGFSICGGPGDRSSGRAKKYSGI